MNEHAVLVDGARAMGVALTADQGARLLQLLDELDKWNRAYNLTSIDGRAERITHHLLDSLSVYPYLHGTKVADVGTGAGFPGLPLALASPERHFTLIDSNNKKVRFVGHAARTLGLTNVTALHGRVESMHPPEPFDTVLARAFAALPQLLENVAPLCGPDTHVLAMKGKTAREEAQGVSSAWRVVDIQDLVVPGLDAARQLVTVVSKALP